MPTALSVAKEFSKLSESGPEPDPLTNLRLQKLLYYAQAWSLVTRKTQLFADRIEAWRFGPVVRSVYEGMPKDLGKAPIDPVFFESAADLGREEALFVKAVWEAYNKYSPTALSAKTHNESPWKDVWGDRPTSSVSHDEITPESMETYFSNQDMVSPLSDYEHRFEKLESQAWEDIGKMPQLSTELLDQFAVS